MHDLLDVGNQLSGHTWRLTLWPRMWQEYDGKTVLDWTMVKLDGSERGKVPTEAGIYTLLARAELAQRPATSPLMYVGKTVTCAGALGTTSQPSGSG